MFFSISYIILALLGVGFLILIHELGHYWMARRLGITVEVFSIGFGKPILQWEHKGVKWQVGWLPFGGYVKMAGMERKEGVDPHLTPNGFFSQSPAGRIKVAAMGPITNIVFALLAFTIIWSMGGREKPFSQFTQYIGWVNPSSYLYNQGVRSGDQLSKVNGQQFEGVENLFYAAALEKKSPLLQGFIIDYTTGTKAPFSTELSPGVNGETERLNAVRENIFPAQFLSIGVPLAGSPFAINDVGIGDRIVWADGQRIFSNAQLSEVMNDGKTLLTVERRGKTFTTRLPKLFVKDIQMSAHERGELEDWRFESKMGKKLDELLFIPYAIDANAIVQNSFSYIDGSSKMQKAFTSSKRSSSLVLEPGDRIIAVDGIPIHSCMEMVKLLQTKHVTLIVEKKGQWVITAPRQADQVFEESLLSKDLQKLINSVGLEMTPTAQGSYRILPPVQPVLQSVIIDRNPLLFAAEQPTNPYVLGVQLQDSRVLYNPNPFALFGDVMKQTWGTLVALISGQLSPKHLVGPVGIVHVMQGSWADGVKEGLFWLGMISFNLGLLNLLPIPVLDGGYICFALYEKITRRKIPFKVMEKLIIPFVILMILFFVYVTYQDISRLIGRFWQ